VDRDLSAFLVQLSIAIHKSATYPPGHPLAAAAVDVALKSLTELLRQRPVLALGVTRTQIVIDGESTDATHPVLRELAQRLYRCQLGGLSFSLGLDAEELTGVLRAMSGDAAGLAAADPATWPHIGLHALAFDQLRLANGDGDGGAGEGQGDDKLSRLWADLVGAALGLGSEAATHADPQLLAAAIDARAGEKGFAQTVTRQLLALSRQTRIGGGQDNRMVSKQLPELLASIKPETLHRLLQFSPDAAQREQLLLELSRSMPVDAVVELLRAASKANQQTISHGLLRILAKLAAHAQSHDDAARSEADDSLRDMVRELVDDWALKDPNPEVYSDMLEGFARPTTNAASVRQAKGAEAEEPLRLVETALELGTWGASIGTAVTTLIEREEVPALLGLLAQTPDDNPAAEALWSLLPLQDELRRALSGTEPDAALVERLLPRLGLEATDPLLDALAEAASRALRRRLLTWLTRLGPGIGSIVLARLDSPHWYVLRNMLVLLAGMDPWPSGFSPAAFLTHADARVRREALKLALRTPELRDQAICTGLTDGDELILRTALAAALDGCPLEAAPLRVDQVESHAQPADVRLLLVRVLAMLPSTAARDCLIRRVQVRRRWMLWRRLAPKSPEMVAAVAGLAGRWSVDPAAANVLRLARSSRDADVRTAAGAVG
jgi:hypothetical protein